MSRWDEGAQCRPRSWYWNHRKEGDERRDVLDTHMSQTESTTPVSARFASAETLVRGRFWGPPNCGRANLSQTVGFYTHQHRTDTPCDHEDRLFSNSSWVVDKTATPPRLTPTLLRHPRAKRSTIPIS